VGQFGGGGRGQWLKQRLKQMRQSRLGQVSGEQRGDRDAQLRSGQLEGQLPQRLTDLAGGGVPGGRLGVHRRAVDGDQRELRCDKERVTRGE
jgi:hypothetical protein